MRTRAPFAATLMLAALYLSGCAPAAAATPFVPPAPPSPSATPTAAVVLIITPAPAVAVTQAAPTPEITPSPTACTDTLRYIEDLNYPDGSIFPPNTVFTKRWLVQNNGTCNWNEGYRVRFDSGDPLGASAEHLLYPARPGAQAVIEITFTTPAIPGAYESVWQVYDPQGQPVGQVIYTQLVVQTP